MTESDQKIRNICIENRKNCVYNFLQKKSLKLALKFRKAVQRRLAEKGLIGRK